MKRALLLLSIIACGSGEKTVVAVAPRPTASSSNAPAPSAPPVGTHVRVHFEGLTVLTESDLAPVVEIDKPKKNIGSSNRDVLDRDVMLIQAELYDRGYINGKLKEPRVEIGADGVIDVTFHVEEGVRFRMTKLWVEELDDTKKPVTPLATVERAKTGDWFSRKVLVQDISAITTKYRDAGYAMVEVTPETDLDADKQSIEIKIAIKRGPIVSFRTIAIEPPSATIAADAARKWGVAPGTRYSETKLDQIKHDLESRGVHCEISTREVRGKPDAVDVTIEVH